MEHAIDLVCKINVFLIESFPSSRSLLIILKCKSFSEIVINSGMRQNSIFIYLFFSGSIVSLLIFCVRLLFELMLLFSCLVIPSNLSQQVKNQNYWFTLREKCPYLELFWSVSSRIRTEYRPE